MLTITDVSGDETARERSRIPGRLLDGAASLGFSLVAWTCALPDGLRDTPVDRVLLLSAVHVDRARRTFLALTHFDARDDIELKTLFEDGTIVSTAAKPERGFWKHRFGLSYTPARHAYRLAFFEVRSVGELAAIHEARVREEEARGRRAVAASGVRVYFAMRRRWREIADARMKRQQSFAFALGLGAAMGCAAVGAAVASVLASVLVGFLGVALALPVGIGAFVLALYTIAPILARGASAPPPRPAHELLALADAIRPGLLPPPSPPPAAEAPVVVHLSAAELARAQRIDLVATAVNATLLPACGLVALAMLGTAGVWVALGIVFCADALVALVMKRTRHDLVRAALVPELARAAAVCTSPTACALGKGAPWIWLTLGVTNLIAARAVLAKPIEPAPAWLFVEWCGLLAMTLTFAIARTKKSHRRIVAA